jgi:SAM-dependent methyltransferase
MRSAVEQEFDAKAPGYESNRLAGWYKAQGDAVLAEIPSISGMVVDVGCGSGWLLRRIVERNPQAIGIGIDLSGQMIRMAQEYRQAEGLDRLTFVHGDWEDSGARARLKKALHRPVSLVVCVSAFHYFREPGAAIHAMHELLGEGGRILLLDRALDGSIGTVVWDLLHRYLIRDGTRFYRTRELVTLLEESGCHDVHVLRRINRLFWNGKMHTSLALISGRCRGDQRMLAGAPRAQGENG